eukprot:340059_1
MANKANPGETATIDPDMEWCIHKNPECRSTSWYSSSDGSFEAKLAKESPLDSFTGINYNKIASNCGEYYGYHEAPLFKYEYDADEYYSNLTPTKPDEDVQAELNEPVQKMEAKLEEFEKKGEEILWTPTLEYMSTNCVVPVARALEYEITPYFQLNKLGYRKNWANMHLCELQPFKRLQLHWYNASGDFFFRFQMMRWNLTSKMKMRYWKMIMAAGFVGLMLDHRYARQYKRKLKWH